jgi:hypothetical protein
MPQSAAPLRHRFPAIESRVAQQNTGEQTWHIYDATGEPANGRLDSALERKSFIARAEQIEKRLR